MKKKKKKKKKRSSPHFVTFPFFHFQFSTLPFTIFLLFFSIFPPFPYFPCLFFPRRSAEISQSQISGGTLPPPPVTPLLQFVARQQNVTVIVDDTDVLILLIHHYQPHYANIFFKSKIKLRDGKVKLHHVDIRMERERLGNDVAELSAIHGCDTVSALYGKGKLQIQNKVKQSEFVRTVDDVFSYDTSTQMLAQICVSSLSICCTSTECDSHNRRYRCAHSSNTSLPASLCQHLL